MRGGTLRRIITIQQGTPSTDSEGNAILTWSTLTTTAAAIVPTRAVDIQVAAQRDERITHQVTIRYRTGLPNPASLRFVYGSRYFFVKGITDVEERHRQLVCDCEEIVSSQTGAE